MTEIIDLGKKRDEQQDFSESHTAPDPLALVSFNTPLMVIVQIVDQVPQESADGEMVMVKLPEPQCVLRVEGVNGSYAFPAKFEFWKQNAKLIQKAIRDYETGKDVVDNG